MANNNKILFVNGSLVLCFVLIALNFHPTSQSNIWPQCEATENPDCTSQFPYCPDCSMVDCLPKWTSRDCPEGTIFHEKLIWGCCPGCVKYLAPGDNCKLTDYEINTIYNRVLTCGLPKPVKVKEYFHTNGIPIVERFECGPDSEICLKETFKCGIENQPTKLTCSSENLTYQEWYKNAITDHICETNDWERKCTSHGKFQPVQAKGNPITIEARLKFCFDPDGNRIGGTSLAEDETMNCLCSRKHWELQQTIGNLKRSDVTLHCQSNGNYEPLQCDQNLCWCVNPSNGDPVGGVVHKDLVQYLDCFKKETFGASYLRRCDSRSYGQAYSQKIFELHGALWDRTQGTIRCDIDGSFGTVYCEKSSKCTCVDKYKQILGAYDSELINMDCRCARDNIGLTCDPKTGAYTEFQVTDNRIFCVDQDGFINTYQYKNQKCDIPSCPSRSDMCSAQPGLCVDNCPTSCSEI